MALGTIVLVAVLVLAGAAATLVQAAAVVHRGGSRASAAIFAAGWLLLVFIPVAWGIFGGQTAWYVQAVGAYDFAGAIPFHLGGGVGALAILLFIPHRDRQGSPRIPRSWPRPVLLAGIAALWIGWLMVMELDLNPFVLTIVINSVVLAGTSLVVAVILERMLRGRNSTNGAVIGLITGLAAATASCAFLEPATAGITGLLAGTIASVIAFRKTAARFSLAGAIAITNLVGGATGLLMIGLLEPTRGFFYTGSFALPVAQGTAVIVCVVYCVLVAVPLALVAGGRPRRREAEWAIPDSNR
ncbi:hypothetical protein [Homoserinimonas sp. A520]